MNTTKVNAEKNIHPEIQEDSLVATFTVAVHARDGTVFEFTARYDLPFGRSEPHLALTEEYFSNLVERHVAHTATTQMRVYLRELDAKYQKERQQAAAQIPKEAVVAPGRHMSPGMPGAGIALPPRPMPAPKAPVLPNLAPFEVPLGEEGNSQPRLNHLPKSKAA